MKCKLLWLTLFFSYVGGLSAQVPAAANWQQIANENQSISTTSPATIQVCGDSLHCTPAVLISSWPISIAWGNGTAEQPAVLPVWGTDPQFNTVKRIGVIQTTLTQNFTVDGVAVVVPALPFVPVWQFVCPANCNILSITSGTVGVIPTMKVGVSGTGFANSPNTITDAPMPVYVQQDGQHGFTFTWSDDWNRTINQTSVGAIGGPIVIPINACIQFSLLPGYAAILCGPVAKHLTYTSPTQTTN